MFLRGKHETRSFARVRGYDGRQRTERQRELQYHMVLYYQVRVSATSCSQVRCRKHLQ